MAIKNAEKYTEKLDKIADEIQKENPTAALGIDLISDMIEGRREASTLKFDADEGRYMANRFNYNVRSREGDEPYMDSFNKSDFEQVTRAKKDSTPINAPYQKIQEK